MENSKQQKAESIQSEELLSFLQLVIDLANCITNDRKDLKNFYLEWAQKNRKIIESLTEVKDLIIDHNMAANIASSIACGVAIAGSVCTITGAIIDKQDLIETGEETIKKGSAMSLAISKMKSARVKLLCDDATATINQSKRVTDTLDEKVFFYFRRIAEFKKLLKEAEENNTLPILLAIGQRVGCDFIGELDLDYATKSNLVSSLGEMCNSNSETIQPSETIKSQEIVREIIGEIPKLLEEFKRLLVEDDFLRSIFTNSTRRSLGENVDELRLPLYTAKLWLEHFSGKDDLQVETSADYNRTVSGIMSGVVLLSNVVDLLLNIKNADDGCKSEESEELDKRIKEIEIMRKDIIELMEECFGWHEPGETNSSNEPAIKMAIEPSNIK